MRNVSFEDIACKSSCLVRLCKVCLKIHIHHLRLEVVSDQWNLCKNYIFFSYNSLSLVGTFTLEDVPFSGEVDGNNHLLTP